MTGDLIMTFNAGSSTVKMGFYELVGDLVQPLAHATIDYRDDPLEIRLKRGGRQVSFPLDISPGKSHVAILGRVFAWLEVQFDLTRLAAIGHRVVHGGDHFDGPVVVDEANWLAMNDLAQLAPLHQPQSLHLLQTVRTLYPDVMQTASFDTAFHRTNPALVQRFAIPRALHDEGVKRYGFHGLSYRYIAGQLDDLPAGAKVVAAHLGSGASLCAMEGGISRDSSMGFSTLDGIPMATRSGALDPGVILHLMGSKGWTLEQVETMLYRESGLLGVSGINADSRELLASPRPEAAEAIALFCHRIAGEVARLATTMGGIDALVFTAGIGENQPRIRAMIAENLAWLGLALDPDANARNARRISAPDSAIAALVIATDEESVIANEAAELRKAA